MSTIINATTTNGVVIQPDNSGSLVLQTNNGTTALTIDTSQRAAFVAGTAAAPAITTTGDTNTGMFFPAADTIAFAEGGTEAMRLDSSGNVGIGTASPGAKLQIGSATYAPNSNLGNNLLQVKSSSGYAYITIGNGDSANSTSYIGGASGFTVFGSVTDAGSLTERMRIDSGGSVFAGVTTLTGTLGVINAQGVIGSKYAFRSHVNATDSNGQMSFTNPNGIVGSISTNGSTTTYSTSSDYRLKENIAPMIGALDKISALKPVTYKWKVDGSDGQGFIAHELADIVPNCVTGEKDAVDEEGNPIHQGVDTSFLVATLTAAIQEQQTIINDLKARITVLEAK